MTPRDNDPLHAPINAKLAETVANLPTAPAWLDAWTALGPESTEEARLAAYQAVRDSGCLPEEAGFYLVSWQIDAMTSMEAEIGFRDLDGQMKAVEREHGLDEGAFWLPGEAPQEYEDLRLEYQGRWNELFATKLQEFGEQEMAELFRENPEAFQRKSDLGQQFFHGSKTWVDGFVEAVAACMTSDSPMGPLGYRYGEEEGFWEIDVYATPVELVGGAVDGEVVAPGFTLDVEELRPAFDEIKALMWHSLGFPHDEGPRLVVEGVYQGREVFLQVLAYAPEDEEPGMRLDTRGRGE
jgi:hypothetical protein